ncbi:MAG: hypothetical protein WA117_19470 [Verrucomicrobiia bacterium]
MIGFRHEPMRRAQAALLYMALEGGTFTAADLPGEITGGSKHLAGAATGSLIAIGLLVAKGRVKSPDVSAKGRKLDLLAGGETERIRAWLKANGYSDRINTEPQGTLGI